MKAAYWPRQPASLRILTSVSLALLISGCAGRAIAPERILSDTRAPLADRFVDQPEGSVATDTPDPGSAIAVWPNAYGDPRLGALVGASLAANHDLAVAGARLREARAGAAEAASTMWPAIDLTGFRARA